MHSQQPPDTFCEQNALYFRALQKLQDAWRPDSARSLLRLSFFTWARCASWIPDCEALNRMLDARAVQAWERLILRDRRRRLEAIKALPILHLVNMYEEREGRFQLPTKDHCTRFACGICFYLGIPQPHRGLCFPTSQCTIRHLLLPTHLCSP